VKDLVDRLDAVERTVPRGDGRPARVLRPRDAATLLILDRSAGGRPRVLIGRRHARHVFMPGKFVFPGGRVDPTDARVPVADDYHPDVARKLVDGASGRTSAARARAFGVAAARETYEEAGLFIGAAGVPRPPSGPQWSAFAERGLAPSLKPMRLVARAITPPGRPRRFDTRFFAVWADAIADRLPTPAGPSGELEEVCWVPLDEAPGVDMPTISHVILEELTRRLSADADLAPGSPIPFYRWRHGHIVRSEV
jgi:8-oxo-dGTP pyrophosphatase MutT (NUDIX family)